MLHGEDLGALSAGALIQGELGEAETGARLREGGQWHGGLEDRRLHRELGPEAIEHLQSQGAVSDRLPDVGECGGETLKTAAVVVDAEIAADGLPELLAQIHGLRRLVVEEVLGKPRPDGEGSRAGRRNNIEKIPLDGGE